MSPSVVCVLGAEDLGLRLISALIVLQSLCFMALKYIAWVLPDLVNLLERLADHLRRPIRVLRRLALLLAGRA